jgi:Spy/CpxP family protein refolding chaperone
MNPETKRQARLWLAIVFLLGAGIGIVFGYAFAQKSHAALNGPTTSEPERRAKRVQEMTREIGLSPEQSQKLDATIAAAHEEMKKIRERSDGEVEALRARARDQMRTIMTPEQMPKFEEFIRKLDEERKKQGGMQGK